ncbi:MAG: transcriptional regulator, partial [Gemmatimonadetes bacterium]|nr:transcriptional regulator [Gemmatimonadota bacterium]NIU80070.1 transcriptional regulator [Gammaproteobacteria bacterium]NIQ59869.1 transcriptional regulator [Gemmatimonadota bacterium]NIW37932.1 transcriptional regulator [Gemmatimonadota bacterium]NIX48489.1 transcriptional regulator [Gemmatimonadota bacterium]
AVVETPEGARFMAQVVDCEPEEVVPGLDLDLQFRRIRREGHGGILCYGHKAVPARS